MATKINKEKLKLNINSINENLNSLAKDIKNLSTYLDAMMKGNADGPYWNGAAAKKYYTKAVTNLKNDIIDYQAAYNKLNAIAVKYENLTKNDK